MKSVSAVVILKATTVIIPEAPVTTLALKESAAGLVPVLSETASTSMDTVHTIIEKASGSASTKLALAMDIMEELAPQMVQQFFVSIKSCIKLVLSERSSFEFARMLLEN